MSPKTKSSKKPSSRSKSGTAGRSPAARPGPKAASSAARGADSSPAAAGRAKPASPARGPAAKGRGKKAAPGSKAERSKPRRPRLTPKQIEYYRDLLNRKRQQLTAAYQTSKGDSRSDLDDGTEDYIDYAVHSYAREFLLSLTEMDRKQLFLVEEALERLDRGQFGYCQQCQAAIHPKRLEVAPWARYCVPCQELEEQGLLDETQSADETDEETLPVEEFDAAADAVEVDVDIDAGLDDDDDLISKGET